MDLAAWHGGRLKTLVILGAGASRGASFAAEKRGPLPPLDLDFFRQLQRLGSSDPVDQLLAFVRSEFGARLNVSMEEFFSQAEYTDRFHAELRVDRGARIRRYRKALDAFYGSIPLLFAEAVGDSRCSYHERLVRMLFTEDAVMSFNYDCIVDAALRDAVRVRWDPGKKGYGFALASGADHWRGPRGKGHPKGSITLLKPHGSLNWTIKSDRVTLTAKPYQTASADGRIVPPTWFKRLQQDPYASVWKRARLEVRRCKALLVIGYSVPVTDLFSRALFKAEAGSKVKREKLEFLVLANPDRVARERFVELVRGAIEPSTRILEFDGFQELVDSLDGGKPGIRTAPLVLSAPLRPTTQASASRKAASG